VQASDSVVSVWTAADYERIEEFVEGTPLFISTEDNPDNLPAQEWLSTQSYLLEGEAVEQRLGNQQGVRFNWAGMWEFTSVAVPHPTRQTMIIITWDSGIAAYEGLFEDIVANLDFI
ncbi:MAG: hypothetical protein VKL39_21890, partial [Leptolyngbyaceae bacterium]|nr:hypothetical protein [Leptolyngbyaceae bacterium]